jgi:thiamine-phosphate pyrophosphorylase
LGLSQTNPLPPVFARNNPFPARQPPLLCYVTDRRSLPVAHSADSIDALTRKIAEVVAAGVDWVQIREKDLTARELASLTRKSLRIAASSSAKSSCATRVLVNDRLDVAIAERAAGVHLGERSLPVAEAKRLVELALRERVVDEAFLGGVSCHSLEAAETAERDGADYIFFGPIFATPSKAAFGTPQGVERLAQVCRTLPIPVIAIGGITLENAAGCIDAGAAGIAAIRLFQDAVDPIDTIQGLRQLFTDCRRRLPADQKR